MALKSLLSRVVFLYPFIRGHNIIYKIPSGMPNVYDINISYKINSVCFKLCRNIATIKRKEKEKGFDEAKAKLILKLNFQSPEDAVPFYKLPIRTLIHIYKTNKHDEKCGYCKNRLYYISSRIKIPPSILSEQLSKRTFIYSLSFEWLESSLNVLLDMGVPGDRILRDLWVLKYHHKTIQERLQRIKDMGMDSLYTWMVRCSQPILNRSIEISQETKSILGENKTTQVYLANRLNISLEAVEEICLKIPALKTIRVIKLKHFLDFLIEEGFTVDDIAMKARVLLASQETVKQRLDKLRKLGVQEINLNILCRSRKAFGKYCEAIETVSKQYTYGGSDHVRLLCDANNKKLNI